ncbi:MAG: carbon storage regulator [Thermoleophilaceae bacterium]|nr:carbon storage regulator [Thermoleophilaceae bacterium]
MIADDVEISVLSIVGDKVRIGIEAPKSVPIFRKEVYLQIKREQESGEGPDVSPKEVAAALDELSNG